MLTTPNYGLKKPELTDSPPDITATNPNWDKIDSEMKAIYNGGGLKNHGFLDGSGLTLDLNSMAVGYHTYYSDTGYIYLLNSPIPAITQDDGGFSLVNYGDRQMLVTAYGKKIYERATALTNFDSNATYPYGWKKQSEAINPNLLVNGDFAVWQREDNLMLINTGMGVADRWKIPIGGYPTNDSLVKAYKDDDGGGISFSKASSNTTAETVVMRQALELSEPMTSILKDQGCTVSGSIYSRLAYNGTAVIKIYDGANLRGTSGTIYINAGIGLITDFSVPIALPSIIGPATIHYELTLTGIKTTGDRIAVRWLKMEVGKDSTPFVSGEYASELAKCKRYYQKVTVCGIPNTAFVAKIPIYTNYPVDMVKTPTVKSYRASSGAANGTLNLCAQGSVVVTAIISVGPESIVSIDRTGGATLVAGRHYSAIIELDAETY